MTMDATRIALKKLHAFITDTAMPKTKATPNPAYVLTFNAMLMNLGFILSEEAFSHLSHYNKAKIAAISDEAINVLATLKGSHVTHHPMYPNFPRQVIDADYLELSITHCIETRHPTKLKTTLCCSRTLRKSVD
jgi:hypothetical protein